MADEQHQTDSTPETPETPETEAETHPPLPERGAARRRTRRSSSQRFSDDADTIARILDALKRNAA